MRRAILLILLLLAMAPFALPAQGTSTLDQTWMDSGITFALAATLGAPEDPTTAGAGSTPFLVVIHEVTSASVTLHWVPALDNASIVQAATYDRASRIGPGGGALLWVNQADLDAGHALIGETTAYVTLRTPTFAQFNAGSLNFYYSTLTGLLIRAEDINTGSSIVLADHLAGTTMAATNDPRVRTLAHVRRWSPDVLLDQPHPATDDKVPCAGLVSGPLGGKMDCWGWFWATRPYDLEFYTDFPFLGIGEITITVSDALGAHTHVRCTSVGAAVDPVMCDRFDLRSGGAYAHGIHFVDVHAGFSHCLNPLRGFTCDWAVETHLGWAD